MYNIGDCIVRSVQREGIITVTKINRAVLFLKIFLPSIQLASAGTPAHDLSTHNLPRTAWLFVDSTIFTAIQNSIMRYSDRSTVIILISQTARSANQSACAKDFHTINRINAIGRYIDQTRIYQYLTAPYLK